MTQKKRSKSRLGLIAVLILALTMTFSMPASVSAASGASLNKTKATVSVGRYVKLKVQNTKKSVTWSSNKPSVAKVSKKGKVTGVKKGTATITAKVGKRKLKCTVKVKPNEWSTSKNLKKINSWENEPSVSKSTDIKAQVASISYNAEGVMVAKVALLNHSSSTQPYNLKNMSMTVKSKKGKVLAQGNFKFNTSINHFTFEYVNVAFDNGGTSKKVGDLRKNFGKKISVSISVN